MDVQLYKIKCIFLYNEAQYLYRFTHESHLIPTKEEIEEMTKHDAKVCDGLYDGPINYQLVRSGEAKIAEQSRLEREYKEENPINKADKTKAILHEMATNYTKP
jgi:hypothetical protein